MRVTCLSILLLATSAVAYRNGVTTGFGVSNAITGGTGKYACASGEEIFLDGGVDYFASDLTICNTCA
jgi:hypothetical protein